MPVDERLQRGRRQQRHIAGQQNDGPCLTGKRLFRLKQGMTRAELRILAREPEVRPSRQRRLHGLGLVADDDHDGRGGNGIGRAKDVLNQGQAGRGVQNLGKSGFHPRSLACRKDDEVERVHRRFRIRPRPGPAGASVRSRNSSAERSGSRSGS